MQIPCEIYHMLRVIDHDDVSASQLSHPDEAVRVDGITDHCAITEEKQLTYLLEAEQIRHDLHFDGKSSMGWLCEHAKQLVHVSRQDVRRCFQRRLHCLYKDICASLSYHAEGYECLHCICCLFPRLVSPIVHLGTVGRYSMPLDDTHAITPQAAQLLLPL